MKNFKVKDKKYTIKELSYEVSVNTVHYKHIVEKYLSEFDQKLFDEICPDGLTDKFFKFVQQDIYDYKNALFEAKCNSLDKLNSKSEYDDYNDPLFYKNSTF